MSVKIEIYFDSRQSSFRKTSLTGSVPFSIAAEPDGTNASGDNPKAYLTVLFLDERFNFVQEGSAHYRIQQSGNGAAPLIANELLAPKNGYAYVYVSNESDEMVYFDNLQVTNKHSAIIEEDHYYAFGLKIAGISSRKLADPGDGNIDNKDLYNDKELSDEGDLDWYEYGFRNYDVQIGRFPQVDPLTDMYPFLTPFQYAGNEPIANVDLEGLETGGLPTPGGVWNGSFLQQAGSHVGHELTAAQTVATEVVTATNVAAKAIASAAAGQNGPRLIAYSADNKLLNPDGSPADDSRHAWNPTKDNEDDLRKKMEQLIRDQTSDDPKMQAMALKMMKRFLDNTGGEFSDPDLDDKVDHDDNFKDFENNVMVRINEQLAKVDGDIDKMKDFTIGNPAFNRWANNSDGLGITIHGVSYVEVHLLKFEKHGNRGDYSIQIQIDLFDNFGLGANDLEIENVKQLYKLWGKDKLNAWLKLQHNFDHVPLRTHVTEKIGARMNIHSTYRRH